MIHFGIDLGGTKIEIAALNPEGDVLLRERVPTPQGRYVDTLEAIRALVRETSQTLGCAAWTLGLGVPGSLSPATGLMRNANSTCLNGQPLQQDLERILDHSLSVSNDANCFALSEAVDGAGQNDESVFAVIVGTGTGAGMVVDGKLVGGYNGVAGEWGHNPLPWMDTTEYPGAACWCGQRGCIETFLSGPALVTAYTRQGGERVSRVEEIVARAVQGSAQAENVLLRYEENMAKALAHVINVLDPAVIVLGGGLSNIQRLYENVPRLWGQYVFSDTVKTRLVPPRFGDSSGVRGAAWLGARDLRQRMAKSLAG